MERNEQFLATTPETPESGITPQQNYAAEAIRQKLNREPTKADIENLLSTAEVLMDKARAVAQQEGLKFDDSALPKSMVDTLDEAHGNFNRIFPNNQLQWDTFLEELHKEKYIAVELVKPEEYFHNVANGMDVEVHKTAVEAVQKKMHEDDPSLAQQFLSEDPKKAVAAAQKMMRHSKYVHPFLDEKFLEKGKQQGKDHIATMQHHLQQLADGHTVTALVAKYVGSAKYGPKKTKTILDGTHRVLAAALTGQKALLFEVDIDAMTKKKTGR